MPPNVVDGTPFNQGDDEFETRFQQFEKRRENRLFPIRFQTGKQVLQNKLLPFPVSVSYARKR